MCTWGGEGGGGACLVGVPLHGETHLAVEVGTARVAHHHALAPEFPTPRRLEVAALAASAASRRGRHPEYGGEVGGGAVTLAPRMEVLLRLVLRLPRPRLHRWEWPLELLQWLLL